MNPKDPSNFRSFLLDFPNQFEVGFKLAEGIKIEGEFNKMVVSGMGGSALPVNLLQSYLADYYSKNHELEPVLLDVNRTYSLPPVSYHSCLNVISSYSGTTEETISCFNEALENNLPVIGISSGGKIEEICKEKAIPHVKLPIPFDNFQPRVGTGYFFSVFYKLMVNHNLIKDNSIQILDDSKKLGENLTRFEESGKALSENLKGKTPIIYAPAKYASVAMVSKIVINENSKTPAFWNYFPELNHNEMIGYTNPQGGFVTVMIKDHEDNKRNQKRYEITKSVINEKGIESVIVEMENGSAFYKIFSTILIMAFASYYLALSYDQDPTPVEMVERFKKLLD